MALLSGRVPVLLLGHLVAHLLGLVPALLLGRIIAFRGWDRCALLAGLFRVETCCVAQIVSQIVLPRLCCTLCCTNGVAQVVLHVWGLGQSNACTVAPVVVCTASGCVPRVSAMGNLLTPEPKRIPTMKAVAITSRLLNPW